MKKQRLRINKIINRVNFKMESLTESDGRHILKLLANSKVNNCLITCKYKEYNEFSASVDGIARYTPIKYIQSVQIKALSKEYGVKVYEILSSSSYPQTNTVNVIYSNANPCRINPGDKEFEEFQTLLNNLNGKMDKFLMEFIQMTLDGVIIESGINQTPECVEKMVQLIQDMENKHNLTR